MTPHDNSPAPAAPASPAPGPGGPSAVAPDHRLPPGDGRGSRSAGLGDLVRELADDFATLVRQEIALARMEVTRTATGVAKDGAWIAVGAAVAAVGGLVLVVALALALGALLGSYWLGTLITGLLLLLTGALFAWKGMRDFKRRELAPTRTMTTLRDDAEWARREAEELKQGLKE